MDIHLQKETYEKRHEDIPNIPIKIIYKINDHQIYQQIKGRIREILIGTDHKITYPSSCNENSLTNIRFFTL